MIATLSSCVDELSFNVVGSSGRRVVAVMSVVVVVWSSKFRRGLVAWDCRCVRVWGEGAVPYLVLETG